MEKVAWGLMVEMACDEGMRFRDWLDEGGKRKEGIYGQTMRSFVGIFGVEYVKTES